MLCIIVATLPSKSITKKNIICILSISTGLLFIRKIEITALSSIENLVVMVDSERRNIVVDK